MFSVILDDGTTFVHLAVNGSYFVSKTEVRREQFAHFRGKYRVVLESGEDPYGVAGEYEGRELSDYRVSAGGWYFALSSVDGVRLERERTRADIEYLAMMSGIQL